PVELCGAWRIRPLALYGESPPGASEYQTPRKPANVRTPRPGWKPSCSRGSTTSPCTPKTVAQRLLPAATLYRRRGVQYLVRSLEHSGGGWELPREMDGL